MSEDHAGAVAIKQAVLQWDWEVSMSPVDQQRRDQLREHLLVGDSLYPACILSPLLLLQLCFNFINSPGLGQTCNLSKCQKRDCSPMTFKIKAIVTCKISIRKSNKGLTFPMVFIWVFCKKNFRFCPQNCSRGSLCFAGDLRMYLSVG